MIFPSLEKSTKLSVSWYGVPVPSLRYFGQKLPIGDATGRRKKTTQLLSSNLPVYRLDSLRAEMGLANPKSQSFNFPVDEINKFSALISR